MNKNNYVKSMDQLNISEDFNEKTAKKMKAALNQKTEKKYPALKKLALTAASMAVIIAAGTAAVNLANGVSPESNNGILSVESTTSTDSAKTQGITVPLFRKDHRQY